MTANRPEDVSTQDQIRMHLGHIAKMFAAEFHAPMIIHGTDPPGAATMTRRKDEICYDVSEVERGAKIHITAAKPKAIDAVHAFLLFQILDHHTEDNPVIIADHIAK